MFFKIIPFEITEFTPLFAVLNDRFWNKGRFAIVDETLKKVR